MTTAAELPELLTAGEAMAALRISRSTLGRMIERGDLRPVRPGHAEAVAAQGGAQDSRRARRDGSAVAACVSGR